MHTHSGILRPSPMDIIGTRDPLNMLLQGSYNGNRFFTDTKPAHFYHGNDTGNKFNFNYARGGHYGCDKKGAVLSAAGIYRMDRSSIGPIPVAKQLISEPVYPNISQLIDRPNLAYGFHPVVVNN